MDDFSLMCIFDYLNINDLIHLAKINQHFHDLIHQHYLKSRFRKSVVRFDRYASIEEPIPNVIVITKYETILSTLRNFGHFIEKLIFLGAPFNFNQIREISHYIAEYSSQSLIELTLINVDIHLLTTTNQTFHRVERLNIRYSSYIDNFRLDEIYPSMKTFKIAFNFPNRVFHTLRKSYARLENLEFDETGLDGPNVNFQPIFLLNPQLRSLVLTRFPSPDHLRAINDLLHSLTSLTVSCYPYLYLRPYQNGENVHLRHVKRFSIHLPWNSPEILEHFPITFDKLETLEVITHTFFVVPARLIEQNEHLKVLSLPETSLSTNFSAILDVIECLTELEAIILQWSEKVEQSHLWRMMNTIGKLRFVTLIVEPSTDLDQLIVPNEWKLLKVENKLKTRQITFECLENKNTK